VLIKRMLKMSAFSFDACGKTFAKKQNRFSNGFLRQIVIMNY